MSNSICCGETAILTHQNHFFNVLSFRLYCGSRNELPMLSFQQRLFQCVHAVIGALCRLRYWHKHGTPGRLRGGQAQIADGKMRGVWNTKRCPPHLQYTEEYYPHAHMCAEPAPYISCRCTRRLAIMAVAGPRSQHPINASCANDGAGRRDAYLRYKVNHSEGAKTSPVVAHDHSFSHKSASHSRNGHAYAFRCVGVKSV